MLHDYIGDALASAQTEELCPPSGRPLLFDEWNADPEIRRHQIDMAVGRHRSRPPEAPKSTSVRKRKRAGKPEAFPDTWEARYEASLPPKPLCGDDFDMGVFPVQRSIALNYRYLQFNTTLRYAWLIADIDRRGSVWAWERVGLPAPNAVMENAANGHAHLGWKLVFAVNGADPHAKQMRFFTSIERGYIRRLKADRAFYQTALVKNALHSDWKLHRPCDAPYELATLARGLDEKDVRLWTKTEKQAGLGRNVDIFDALRKIAYREVLRFKADGKSRAEFYAALFMTASALNLTLGFHRPLSAGELRTIVKSVAGWTWRRFDEEAFLERQRRCSARGHAKRWAGHVTAEERAADAGISRATLYRQMKRQANGCA